MIQINLAVCLLAVLPLIIAAIYSLAIAPQRRTNMQEIMKLSLSSANDPDVSASRAERLREPKIYIESGLTRVYADFSSQYTYRLYIPATILSFLYLITLFTCMSRVSGNLSGNSWFLRMPASYSVLPAHDFVLYAFIGAYAFNMGVLVRRTFLSDVTEHVYWGAINRLIIATCLALAFYGIPKIPPPFFFVVAFMPQVLLTKLRKEFTSIVGDSDKQSMDLPLQFVQGIDIWKEQRLQEEGIENVQNLATADILTLAVKTHYPLRTLIDWIDQAIFIQRFPASLTTAREKGLPVSAIDFAWMAPSNQTQSDRAAQAVAHEMGLDATVVIMAMDSFYQDSYVNVLWTLWQGDGSDSGHLSVN
jgi:hypothetical protein